MPTAARGNSVGVAWSMTSRAFALCPTHRGDSHSGRRSIFQAVGLRF
jgi:hypothetical protein